MHVRLLEYSQRTCDVALGLLSLVVHKFLELVRGEDENNEIS
jgi:hypothetical protein